MTVEASKRLPPEYRLVWAIGFLWNFSRWMSIFVNTFMVNELTGSPILAALVGASVWAPMFFGGLLGGVISDNFDRRRTLLAQFVVLTPVALVLAVLLLSDNLEVWMVYPYMLFLGLGGVFDMTIRRALILDVVGEARLTRALAFESLGNVGGNLSGTLLGGALIALVGFGSVFLVIAGCYVAVFLLLLRLPTIVKETRRRRSTTARDFLQSFRYARRHRVLIGILGVTVIYNLFYFSFTPLIPVFADRLEVGAILTSVLASALSIGSISGNTVFTRRVPFGRGFIYTLGPGLAIAALLVFAAVPWYAAALVALFFAGVGNACFATMQSGLVLTNVDVRMRGRALGLVSMAIGANPIAMLLLGSAAQAFGPQAAVMANAILGLFVVVLWSRLYPEVHRLP